MKAKNRKRLRVLGKILFVLYIGFLFYFLIFSDWYGREGTGEYHYNLVLFCEIKRFWLYRDVLGWVSYANLFGNVLIFIPFGFFMPMASRYRSFYLSCFASCHLLIILQIAKTIYPITPPRVLSSISSTSKLPTLVTS